MKTVENERNETFRSEMPLPDFLDYDVTIGDGSPAYV